MRIGNFENETNEGKNIPESIENALDSTDNFNKDGSEGKLSESDNISSKNNKEKQLENESHEKKLDDKDNVKDQESPYKYKFQPNQNDDGKLHDLENSNRFDSGGNINEKYDEIVNDPSLSRKEKIDKLNNLRDNIVNNNDGNGSDDYKSPPNRVLGRGQTLESPYSYDESKGRSR